MSTSTARGFIVLVVITLLVACASGGSTRILVPPAPTDVNPPGSPTNPCLVVPQPESPRDTAIIMVEVRDKPWSLSLKPGAPAGDTVGGTAASLASDFVLAQLYQPLVRVTCDGRVVPELAERLTVDTNNGSTRFVLAADTRFIDGSRVTFDDVAASIGSRMRNTVFTIGGAGGSARTVEEGDIVTGDPDGASLFAFGQIARAVSRRGPPIEWPIGSGSFLVDTNASSLAAGTTVLRPAGRVSGPVIVVRDSGSRDQRDILDRGVDILQTRDPVIVDYARRGAFSIHPLPFDRTYILAFPPSAQSETPGAVAGGDTEPNVAKFRSALATDAVRVEARAAETTSWWQGLTCGDTVSIAGIRSLGAQATARIMYDAQDPVARSLAERLVAIARNGGSNPTDRDARVLVQLLPSLAGAAARSLTATPADAESLRAGAALAFVMPIPTRVLARCASLARLRQRAEWMSPAAMLPLIDTRSFLITRAGAPAVLVDWDGTLRVLPAPPVRRLPQR